MTGSSAVRSGQLLISSAAMTDPRFARTVIHLLNVDDDGALGLILNRPSHTGLVSVLEGWEEIASEPAVFFEGGPVEPGSVLGLAKPLPDRQVDGFQHLVGGFGAIDLDRPWSTYDGHLEHLRLYAGYAGWGSGQLQGEIVEGSWHVLDPEPGDVAHAHPERLWSEVLRRQSGELALLSTRPADVSLN